jgi:hypothetical protein
MGPKYIKKKLGKNFFDPLFGPFKNVNFCSFYAFSKGYVNTFFSLKMEQTLHSSSYGSQEPPCLEKKNIYIFDPLFGPFKNVIFFARLTLFQRST